MKPCVFALLALLLGCAAPPAAAQEAPARARAVFTITNEDCVSVDTDGDPWLECGVQAFDVTEDASRILTVSAGGLLQLWDAEGRELQRLDWADQPGGASGYPDARVRIAGRYGVAIVHQNQVVVLDLATGAVLTKRVSDAMWINEIAAFGERVFIGYREKDWASAWGELLLPGGDIRKVADLDNLLRVAPGYWIQGAKAPFKLHRAGMPDVAIERSCVPVDARFCMWRDFPGSRIHVLEIATAKWRSFDAGRRLDGHDSVDVIPAGPALFAVICGRAPDKGALVGPRPCAVRDLEQGRDLHRFDADEVRAAGGIGPMGTAELRLSVRNGKQRALDIVARNGVVTPRNTSREAMPVTSEDGMLVPADAPDASFLLDRGGRKRALLPFTPRGCGFAWSPGCRVSVDGRRWLVASPVPTDTTDQRLQLTLYALP